MDLVVKILLLAIPIIGQARIISSPRKARLTLGEPSPSYYFTNINGYPGTYAFGYDIRDPYTGNIQFRNEERYPNGTVMGNYGYTDANGRQQSYEYIADEKGYRVTNSFPKYPLMSRPTQVHNSGVESSVTWSRPQKIKQTSNYITKLPINKGNINSNSHPIVKTDIENKLVKDEKVLPNGTVVGKYSYADPEGNPIHVKYYADDSSYGVELNSIKVVGAAGTPATLNRLTSIENILQQSTDTPSGISSDFYNPTNIKYKTSDPFEIAKDPKANTPYKNDYKISSDYEIYFQNELKAPKKCGKDKVHIYLDKEKRKIRDVSDSYLEAEKVCNRL